MALNPLAPVTDYQSMLSRVFWFTTAATLLAIGILRANVIPINDALHAIDLELGASSGDNNSANPLPIPGGTLLPALAVGLLARIFRLHGRIAHWLGIRERFEIDVIVTGLARASEVDVDAVAEQQWQSRRYEVMRNAFYRFASSESPQIDPHLIHQALDCWSWFWSGLEATAVLVLAGFTLIAFGAHAPGGITIFLTLTLAFGGLPLIRQQCRRYAIAQVKAIVADPQRASQVREVFAGLPMLEIRHKKSA